MKEGELWSREKMYCVWICNGREKKERSHAVSPCCFLRGESNQCCPSFPFSSPDSRGCFSLAALISSQAPPCWDGGTLFLEREHFQHENLLAAPHDSQAVPPWCWDLGFPGRVIEILFYRQAPFRALLNLLVWHFLGESSHASLSCDLLNSLDYAETPNSANTWKALVGAFLTNYFIGSCSC